jgi:hypothetical protein
MYLLSKQIVCRDTPRKFYAQINRNYNSLMSVRSLYNAQWEIHVWVSMVAEGWLEDLPSQVLVILSSFSEAEQYKYIKNKQVLTAREDTSLS